jgi:predicted NBD/HSP70 family sugar kinase
MYLGVDIGGTKTLVAVLTESGEIRERVKFPTPENYDDFLAQLELTIEGFETKDYRACGVGMPVTVFDRKHGRGMSFGNLPWRNVPVQHDVERLVGCPVVVENDAKLAALSEAMLLKHKYSKVLYVTVSTGIGIGLVANQTIDTSIGDGGGRAILLEHRGKMMPWEDFASGRAIVERYHKRAVDITEKETWQKICRDLAKGFIELIAIMQPEVIVIGGSVGSYFDRYGKLLEAEIKKYEIPLVTLPALRQAQRPEEAVVFGCYDIVKQVFKHADTAR